jgi:hypothetical protein
MMLNGTVACPTCSTTPRIKYRLTNDLVIVYVCLRAISSSALPGGYDVGILIESSVMIGLSVIQFLVMEYVVASPGTLLNSSKH